MTLRVSLTALASAVLIAAPAHAAAPAPAGGGLGSFLILIPMILIFYFLLIRPQQQQRKKHQEMVNAIKRGDTVVTSGGLIGKVTKVAEDELTVEVADGVRVRTIRGMVADVRQKNAPAAAND